MYYDTVVILIMKQTKHNKPKHTVKFIRVLNQPAMWIELEVIESNETARAKYLRLAEINKSIPR
jgi:hypothetical protein